MTSREPRGRSGLTPPSSVAGPSPESSQLASTLQALLSDLSAEECSRVVSICGVRRVETHEQVYRQGDAAKDAVLVLRGMLRATARSATGQHNLNVIRRGELCGESSLYALDAIRSASVHAVEPSVVLVLSPAILDELSGTRFLAWLQRSLLMSTARRLRTNRLAIRKAWKSVQEVDSTSSESTASESAGVSTRSASWWDTLRSSLKGLA